MKKRFKKHPVCYKCRVRMKKKGTIKEGEKRFICPKCGDEL